jgi:hypothetical protein
MKRKCLLMALALLLCLTLHAQQPFEEYGYKVKIATLSGGKYVEFFDRDTLVEIGSVVINTNTGEIVGFVTYDTTYSEATLQPEIISRWISSDPLSEKYYCYSPYHFSGNNPIRFVDPDGQSYVDYLDQNGNKIGTDGNNDGRNVVVTNADEANKIKESDQKGGTTQLNDVKSGVELPSAFVRGRMGDAVDRAESPSEAAGDTKGGMHEEGGMYGKLNGSEVVVDSKPGAAYTPGTDGVGVNPTVPNVPAGREGVDVVATAATMTKEGTYHVHPSGDGATRFVPSPSNADLRNANTRATTMGMTGNSYVLSPGNNTVYIYRADASGSKGTVVATFPLDKFRTK